jgi:hypothetical protein
MTPTGRLLALALAASTSIVHGAEVHSRGSRFAYAVYLDGEIAKGDLSRLKSAFAGRSFKDEQNAMLVIDSPGGDLQEAMAIGRYVRVSKLTVAVPDKAKCFSSCVYILAAGVTKMVFGDVGIHRPYLLNIPAGGVEAAMRNALRQSRDYFEYMNIPGQLADTMFSTPPEKLLILGDDQQSFYRLNQTDIAFSEEQDLKKAAFYGMTRQEYIAKWSGFEKESAVCHKISDLMGMIQCKDRYLVKYGFRPPEGKK